MSSPKSKWQSIPLRDVGSWVGGGTPSKANSSFWSGQVPWVSPKDMKQPLIEGAADHITEAAVEASSTKIVPESSLLVVTRSGILSHTLPVAKTTLPVAISQDIKAVVLGEGYDPDFVLHAIQAHQSSILESCRKSGTTVANLDTERFLDFKLSIPPKAEQRRIVAKLDTIFARSKLAREELGRVPKLVERYKRAVLSAAFQGELTADWRREHGVFDARAVKANVGSRRATTLKAREFKEKPPCPHKWSPPIEVPQGWTIVSVDEVTAAVQYGSSSKAVDHFPGGVPVLRMGNIIEGKLSYENLKYLPTQHDEFPALLLEDGDVLFNRTNSAELVGKTAVYRDLGTKTSFASYLIRLQVVGYIPELLSAYINSPYGRSWVASVTSQQVGQANVNGTKLRELGVPLMRPEEQQEIWGRIRRSFDSIDRLTVETQDSASLLYRLDEAILTRAFFCELDCYLSDPQRVQRELAPCVRASDPRVCLPNGCA